MERKQYTKKQYEQAKQICLVDLLTSQGFTFSKQSYYYRCEEHSSLVIKPNGRWYWNSKKLYGSNAVDFLVQTKDMSPYDAIISLCNCDCNPIDLSVEEKAKPPFIEPKKAENYKRAFAYLNKTRGIDGKIISKMIAEHKIYETADYHNVAFVGFDANERAKYTSLRGTYTKQGKDQFKGDVVSSDKSYGFHMVGKSKTVLVYESPIDALSHATISKLNNEDYEQVHRLSLGCTWDGALKRCLETHEIDKVVFCLDNDEAGNKACEKYMKEYYELGYNVDRIIPKGKDFNEDLKYSQGYKKQSQT